MDSVTRWTSQTCEEHNKALLSASYTEIYLDFVRRWGARTPGTPHEELKPWGKKSADVEALKEAQSWIDWGSREQTAGLGTAVHALKFFSGEAKVNAQTVERLLTTRAVDTLLAEKRAGLARLNADEESLKPEGWLKARFEGHRADVEREIATIESWWNTLRALDLKDPSSVFNLKHTWFDCRSYRCAAYYAFWPFVGPYGSGRVPSYIQRPVALGSTKGSEKKPVEGEVSSDHSIFAHVEKLAQPGHTIDHELRCTSQRWPKTDPRLHALLIRVPDRYASLYTGLSLAEAGRLSQRVHHIGLETSLKTFPGQEPEWRYDAETKTITEHRLTRPSLSECKRRSSIPVPMPLCGKTESPSIEELKKLIAKLVAP